MGKEFITTKKSEELYKNAKLTNNRVLKHIALVQYLIEQNQAESPGFGWENLPWLIQYYPLIMKYIWHMKKVSALNPGMDGIGGLIGASKIDIFSHLASRSYARTLFIKAGTGSESLLKSMGDIHADFPQNPVICKPNMGERSINVAKVRNLGELLKYHAKADFDYLIQEYIPGPDEFGVSCFRNLKTRRLEIAAVVNRRLAKAVGDGKSTIKELLLQTDLEPAYKEKILACYDENQAGVVPDSGAVVMLSPVASLAYGTVIEEIKREDFPQGFEKLENDINDLCVNDQGVAFDGFNYGRFDYRAANIQALFNGEGKILELNGAAAMALHACVPDLPIENRYQIFQEFFDRMLKICEFNRMNRKGHYMHILKLYRRAKTGLQRTDIQRDALKASTREIHQARRTLRKQYR